jgi:Amt family ammonium transporter
MTKFKLLLGLGLLLVTASPALAQNVSPTEVVNPWPLVSVALVYFWPIGMILLISSAMPDDKAPATATTLMMVWGVAALAYFAVGFAFQFGGIAQVSPQPDLRGLYWEWYPLDQSVEVEIARLWGVIALQGWALHGEAATAGAFLLFLSHTSLVGLTAFPAAAVLIQRGRPLLALLSGLLSGGLLYPVAGNWLWGGGWLSNLGASLEMGHGLVDFGGATVVFLAGSGMAFVALLLFKPAISPPAPEVAVEKWAGDKLAIGEPGEASEAETPVLSQPMPPAYLPLLSMLGGGVMVVGWFGLSTAIHAPTALNFIPAQAATAGLLAALSGGLAAAAYSWFTTGTFQPLMTARGLVAGLIVALAGAPFVPIWWMVLAGLLMGLALPLLIYLFEQRLPLADHLGIIATYGVSAIISILLVAFGADGRMGQGWNGLGLADYRGVSGQGVSGLVVAPSFASDWPGQLQAQGLGLSVILVWSILLSFLFFLLVKWATRVRRRTASEPAVVSPAPAVLAQEDMLAEEVTPDSPQSTFLREG